MEPFTIAVALVKFLSAVAPPLIDKFKGNPTEKDLKRGLYSIKELLKYIEATINYQTGKNTGPLREIWIDSLQKLGKEIRCCIQEFETKKNMKEFADKIKALEEDVENTLKRFLIFSEANSEGAPSSSNSGEVAPVPQAANPLEELWKLLVAYYEHIGQGRKLKVISIVAFGDHSKTLLAKQIFDSAVDNMFPRRAPATAAGKSAEVVLKQILGQHAANTSRIGEEDVHQHLESSLGKNRYFIIIEMPKTAPVGAHPGSELEGCLIYFCILPHFGMFPVGHLAIGNSLVRRWLAEEVVPANFCGEGDNLRTLIHRNIPVNNNIFVSKKVSNSGEVKRCTSHVDRSANLIICRDGTSKAENISRASLHNYSGGTVSSSKSKLSEIRNLAVFPVKNGMDIVGLESSIKFKEYKQLEVLDLEDCQCLKNEHVKGICDELGMLKYMSLGGNIDYLPRRIGKLQHLDTLDLRRSSAPMVTVPEELIKLPHLKHLLGKLRFLPVDAGWSLPTGFLERGSFGKLKKFVENGSSLQTLAGFVIGNSSGFPQLTIHMHHLKKLKICFNPTANKNNIVRHAEAIQKFLGGNIIDRSLSIDASECKHPGAFLSTLHHNGRTKVLGSLKLCCKLSEKGKSKLADEDRLSCQRIVPPFVATLVGISELCLSGTAVSWVLIFSHLENLRTLRYLKLADEDPRADVQGKNSARDNDVDRVVINRKQVQQKDDKILVILGCLKWICLVGNLSLPRITIQHGALPALKSLHLLCKNLDLVDPQETISMLELEELALHSELQQEKKTNWEENARSLRKSPTIVYIGDA